MNISKPAMHVKLWHVFSSEAYYYMRKGRYWRGVLYSTQATTNLATDLSGSDFMGPEGVNPPNI